MKILFLGNKCKYRGQGRGYHLVMFDSLEDLKDKTLYYLEHEDEREEIAYNGMNFVRKNYNNTKRVERLINIINKHL